MASPIAHSLTGAIIYYASRRRGKPVDRELLWLILAANLADFDLIPSVLMGDHTLFHRTFSHSILAAVVFALIVYAACQWRRYHSPGRATLLMFAAYVSQLLLDWLSFDPGLTAGVPLLWPFSHEYFMADPTVFLNIERDDLFTAEVIIHNIKAALVEIAILGPPAALLWWWHDKAPLGHPPR